MINFRMLKVSDLRVWGAVGTLVILGLLAVFSTTFRLQVRLGGDPFSYLSRQFISLMLAFFGLAIFSYLDYRHLKKAAPFIYCLIVLLLVLVLFAGSSAQGAQRWFALGPLSFQPSEFSKLGLILALAAFFSERKKVHNIWEAFSLFMLVGIPFFLIFKQPDLGTALVFAAILLGILAASESSPRLLIMLVAPVLSLLLRPLLFIWLGYLLALAIYLFLTQSSFWDWLMIFGTSLVVGLAFPLIWGMLKTYQQQRIVAFLNPAADPYGAGYHTLQSKIAIGSGGLFGKGFLRGTQTQLQFIPEQHSDFIFSAIGEEFGLWGSILTVGSFAVIVWRSLIAAIQSDDNFGKYLASGIAVMIGFHVFANIGMALGILPVVGIPLPFMSYGGSSLFVNLCAIGVIQSIVMRQHKILF